MDIVVHVIAATILVRHVTLVTRVGRRWRSQVVVVHTMPRHAAPAVPDTAEIPRCLHRRVARAQGGVCRGRTQQRMPPKESGSTAGSGHAAPLRRAITMGWVCLTFLHCGYDLSLDWGSLHENMKSVRER
jgi:hypothetical protein